MKVLFSRHGQHRGAYFFRRNRRGYVLMAGAAMAVGLIAFTGLAFDTGYAQLQRTRIQTAADAAATAAVAQSLRLQGATYLTASARLASSYNGFTDGQNGVTVTVHRPPTGGRYAGDMRWIETKVTQNVPTYFLRILNQNSVAISARAVAKAGGGAGTGCVFALNPIMAKGFDLNGNGTIEGCGIVVNSNHGTNAADVNGNYYVDIASFNVTGTARVVGSNTFTAGSYPVSGVAPTPDPLAHKVAPAVPAGCDHENLWLKGGGTKKATLYPGVYCGGIKVNSNWDVTFMPGLYILKGGGIDISTNTMLTGTDVTFYNTYSSDYAFAPVTLNGGVGSDLRAPKNGPYEAMLIFQDRTAPAGAANYVRGSSNMILDGAIYLPTQALEIRGSSSWKYTIIVADNVEISGNTNFRNDYSELANGNPLIVPKSVVFGE